MKTTFIVTSLLLVGFTSILALKNNEISGDANYQRDSLAMERLMYVNQVKEDIKGHEQEMVQTVFGNLQVLRDFPAENLVIAMDRWAAGLGVSCTHCHNPKSFASDEKPQKEIARKMVEMNITINEQLLPNIKGLKSNVPMINCITCHQGALKPPLKLR